MYIFLYIFLEIRGNFFKHPHTTVGLAVLAYNSGVTVMHRFVNTDYSIRLLNF